MSRTPEPSKRAANAELNLGAESSQEKKSRGRPSLAGRSNWRSENPAATNEPRAQMKSSALFFRATVKMERAPNIDFRGARRLAGAASPASASLGNIQSAQASHNAILSAPTANEGRPKESKA